MNTYKPLTEERKLAMAEEIARIGSDAFWDRVYGTTVKSDANPWDLEDEGEW